MTTERSCLICHENLQLTSTEIDYLDKSIWTVLIPTAHELCNGQYLVHIECLKKPESTNSLLSGQAFASSGFIVSQTPFRRLNHGSHRDRQPRWTLRVVASSVKTNSSLTLDLE